MRQKLKRIIPLLISSILITGVLSPISAGAATENQLRSEVVSTAENEVGYKGSSSYSKYGEWYGYQGGWCTTFVLWCFNKAGNNLDVTMYGKIIPSGGNCNSMISWFSNKGVYHKRSSGYAPKKGDLVFFDWSGNGSSQHVGIVTGTSGSTVYTIEGNCSGKVKSREYTKSGSKPYNNISSIMGYGAPNYSSVSSGNTKATKKHTGKKTTVKKHKTTAKHITKKNTTKKKTYTAKHTKAESSISKKAESTSTSKKEATVSQKKTEASSELKPLSKLTLRAATDTLQIGDSVKLEYAVEPADANAVVGYFCDEEGIIEIGSHGEIKAIGEGRATVVVCANDDLYSQKDFVVTKAKSKVTTQTPQESTRKIVGTAHQEVSATEKNFQSQMTKIGININALSKNPQLYIIPAAIISGTFIICIFIGITKLIKNRKK